MIGGVFAAILFIAAKMIEESIIQSLPLPYASLPIMVIFGLLVMHRVHQYVGVTWFVLVAITAHPWGFGGTAVLPFLVGAMIAIPLQQKIFAHRSVYALLGLGLGVYVSMVVTAYLVTGFHAIWSDEPWLPEQFFQQRIAEGIMLIIGLYIGDEIARRLGGWGRRTFYLHR